MSRSIDDIKAPIAKEMVDFEKKFRQSMKSKVLLLDTIMSYIVKRKGKQMRPMFVFLSAGTCGEISEATHRGAALIELLHTASLVHDDVVDDASYRRGFFSINALWKNKIAVLVGDFLLSRGLLLSVEHQDFEMLGIVSQAMKEMSEGELLQMEKARKLDITEEVYYNIIWQKTASLIASCCKIGAASVGCDKAMVDQMGKFGQNIGMAFQIKDDLFDYGDAEIGKPLGIDIKEKKLTLPLIYALNNASRSDRKRVLRTVRKESDDPKKVTEVIDFVKNSGGLDYAKSVMEKYYNSAIEILEDLPDTEYKKSLTELVQYTIDRTK
jgi:octaprenyl-diphosphate synthase